ncbi:cyclopropane-fatty-acyl-phospholipid synthase-like [Folsomia candida]|uniref:cyclopropane-fatty-acyl-phospholipid synthase-like n=1 Tax=Folsomia candida TaxID=158441 RepID=UPI001604D2B7|nr:cyclopropane-fatty-acyl-phospholipid synthase-like [Folsomia candida]
MCLHTIKRLHVFNCVSNFNMYHLSTYFFWLLILWIRLYRWVEFQVLKVLRNPINKIISAQASKHGIVINGQDHCMQNIKSEEIIYLTVRNPNTFITIINQGSIGLGETYMKKWWDCGEGNEEEIFLKVFNLTEGLKPHPMLRLTDWITVRAKDTPWETGLETGWITSFGKDFFTAGLGPCSNFVAGIYSNGNTNMETAQLEGFKYLADKLQLTPGMKVLELGCGYGGLAHFLADNYKVNVTGVTNSREEACKAKEKRNNSKVEIIESDFRELPDSYMGIFDRVICVHMMEHLGGPANYAGFFRSAAKFLKSGGLFVVQSYVMDRKPPLRIDPFTRKYMARCSVVPELNEVVEAVRDNFYLESLDNLGQNLVPFFSAVEKNVNLAWPLLSKKYTTGHYRVFKLVLKIMLALSHGRKMHDLVLVLSVKSK